jgi:hypothetical protein
LAAHEKEEENETIKRVESSLFFTAWLPGIKRRKKVSLSVFVSLSPCMNVLSCYGRWRCDDVTVVINTDGLLNFSDTCSQFPHAGFSDDGPSGQTLEIEREEMSNDRCLHITKRVKERMK